jgi:hypothetical protein
LDASTAIADDGKREPGVPKFYPVHPAFPYRKEKAVNGEQHRVAFTTAFTGEHYIFRAFAGDVFTPAFTKRG